MPGYSGMPNRSIFIVDQQGLVRWTWVRSQEEPFPNYDQVVTAAEEIAGNASRPPEQ